MILGSLGLRSGSYGSLQLQSNQSSVVVRKPQKMFKDKERFVLWFFKVAPRRKVGMLLLCAISALVFGWVVYFGKGIDGQEGIQISSLGVTGTSKLGNHSYYSPNNVDQFIHMELNSSVQSDMGKSIAKPPATPIYFKGYTLPPGNPCESFTLPPPPADKRRTGPRPCPVCYLPVEEAISLMPDAPSFSPVIHNLNYIHEENSTRSEFGGSEFGGYPSLKQRIDSYDIRGSMSIHCGFVRGIKPGRQTGFDLDDSDLLEMDNCRGIVVASAIFGAYDLIQQPKNISETAKENVCFYMFVDEETYKFIIKSRELNSSKSIGLWRIVVIQSLPYQDPRRTGKVPKLLLHRLFPNARYSLWIDGKLELVVDPYQILERFLWRKNASFAISRHYRRFDVFVEAEANKAASKYDNASIDFQVDFYRREGLTPYSEVKLPVTSDVPEGCVIIKEHIPIANLFSCLWYNEVDRFTPRDQISFSTVRDKIMSKTNWTINMFLDCERRNFVVQGYHRDVLEHWAPPPPPGAISIPHPPPLVAQNTTLRVVPRERVASNAAKIRRRGKDRSGSRRHRKVTAGHARLESTKVSSIF
ncbi:Strawberry notch protein [Heracleum sosnowskyi]|uniref:Strawberry notch protein n=1 Tax=Heracleum sosnowskyi TaxID=360622 RepID=A0AAD8I427_9APIA|nr:Strawberry notch protein [Heracleum sosnowskyi]